MAEDFLRTKRLQVIKPYMTTQEIPDPIYSFIAGNGMSDFMTYNLLVISLYCVITSAPFSWN